MESESVGKGSHDKPSTEMRPQSCTHGDGYRTESPERKDRKARNLWHHVDQKTKRTEYKGNNRKETPNVKKKNRAGKTEKRGWGARTFRSRNATSRRSTGTRGDFGWKVG